MVNLIIRLTEVELTTGSIIDNRPTVWADSLDMCRVFFYSCKEPLGNEGKCSVSCRLSCANEDEKEKDSWKCYHWNKN